MATVRADCLEHALLAAGVQCHVFEMVSFMMTDIDRHIGKKGWIILLHCCTILCYSMLPNDIMNNISSIGNIT